ncbi:MAG: UDP-N-acetylmuramate:L-alanyl-gamma-D-glutamyl-meso-diaminopimelate ligase [Neisseriaceae bacterium]|nr:UDP-N-acetylmuramate:L-alanyl-gamma-D-glutamyl-meso-diaminopimelate ligase [Neisseriaceae bacterium]
MKHIHIIGIGGTFMGSLAALAVEAGFTVTGCDHKMYPPMSTQLEKLGIHAYEGFDAEQLNEYQADIYVIGNVAKRTMPVVEEILNRKLPYTSGPQWLAENILQQCTVLAVAGTHGKTTTASMLAWILEYAGLKPGFLIGGVPQNFTLSARLPQGKNKVAKIQNEIGQQAADSIDNTARRSNAVSFSQFSNLFVIEADEYDTAFFDKRSKFVHYHPTVAVLNNLEFDHADIFPDLAAIETQFHHLIRTVPANGLVVANAVSGSLKTVLDKGCWTETQFFNDQNALHCQDNANDGFDIFSGSLKVGEIRWELTGKHNQSNALAALTAAQFVGVSFELACEALSQFKSVKRRMELKGTVNGVAVYDDFAHHPTAIATVLDGIKRTKKNGRIIAVLEPRSNTMKIGTLKDQLAPSLALADKVFCFAGGIDWNVKNALQPLGDKAGVFDDFNQMLDNIVATAQNGDDIVVMSNGGFQGIHGKLLDLLKKK